MAYRHSSIVEAYSVLGLDQGASLETVKSAYKQLALKTHPDKNPNDPDATVQFQQVSSAYNLLLKHLDTSQPNGDSFQHFHSHTYHHFHSHFGDYDSGDDSRSDGWGSYRSSEDEYYYAQEDDDLDFFKFLFEEVMHNRENRFARAQFRRGHTDTETEEQYQTRLKQEREEQEAANARRRAGEEAIKQERQKEREQEILAGRLRREQKSKMRKAEAEASRKATAQKVRMQQEKSQYLRSSAFAAARKGDAAAVKKAIWEDGVDAAGGEVKPGLGDIIKVKPEDPMQTLLHIAVVQGNTELVQWLEKHNAEAEERDSQHLTPFHIALQYGRIPIIRYFLDTYSPADSDSQGVLHVPNDIPNVPSLLRLALHSGEPEVVWLVLEAKLVDDVAIREVWRWISVHENEARTEFGNVGKQTKKFNESAWEEVKELLKSRGGFTPPLTPKTPIEPTPSQRMSSKKRDQEHLNKIPTPPPDSPSKAFRSNPLHSYTRTASGGEHGDRGRRGQRGHGRGRGRSRGQSHTTYTPS